MEMTEKMKQPLVEGPKEEEVELSDEQLDEVAGGFECRSDINVDQGLKISEIRLATLPPKT